MTEKQTNLTNFEARMSRVHLTAWTETEIRLWLTLRERALEDKRREMNEGKECAAQEDKGCSDQSS